MFKKIAIAATLAIMASSSFAADKPSYYAGVDVGSTKIDGFSGHNTSFGGFVGYQYNENVAVEAGYRRLADFDVAVGSANANVTLNQAALSVVGTMPISTEFNVFGRLGYNHIDAKGSFRGNSATESVSRAVYGIGMGYNIAPNVAARLEIQKPSADTTNISVGLAYKF
jgi:OOP family OmpA-OmpF porin